MGLSSKKGRAGLSLLAAAMMTGVMGGYVFAEQIEIRSQIDKVLSGDRIRLELPQVETVTIGDKIRIETKNPDGKRKAIQMLWTVESIDGSVLIASPDGELADSPEEGADAVILSAKPEKQAEKQTLTDNVTEVSPNIPPRSEDTQALPVQTAAPAEALKVAEEANAELSNQEASQQEPPKPVAQMPEPSASEMPSENVKAQGEPETSREIAIESKSISGPQASDNAEVSPPKVSETLTQSTSITEAANPSEDRSQSVEASKTEPESSMATGQSSDKEIPEPESASENDDLRQLSSEVINQCDLLAAHPFDPEAVAPGIAYRDLNVRKIIEACKKAIEHQPDIARFYTQLTRGLHKDGQLEAAFEATRKGAELGSAHSMAYLGVMHRQGTTVEKDAAEALSWFEKAAEAGNPGGMIFAAAMYRDGIGAKRNMTRAAELYLLASREGVAEANTNLAIFYDRGSGVKRDAAKSAHFMLEAYGAEDKSALRILNDSSNVLSVATRKAIQQELRKFGFYRGGIDGQLGTKSRAALSLFAKQRKVLPVQNITE